MLLASSEVDETAFRAWLPGPECGSSYTTKVDITSTAVGITGGGEGPEVFECLGEFENALKAAQVDLDNLPLNIHQVVSALTAMGRCYAKLGRAAEAREAFERAIREARRCVLPFMELIARRDFVIGVLDAEGKREDQLYEMGVCIKSMASPPGAFRDILGASFDPEALVAAVSS